MTYNEAIKELEDIREIVRFYGDPENVKQFINDQGVECGMRSAYGKRFLEIWQVKGEVRMRIHMLYENTYYSLCAIISVSYYSQLKLEL